MLEKKGYKRKYPYENLPESKIMEIYNFTMRIRQEKSIGQRLLSKEVFDEFGINISENTISGIRRKQEKILA